MNQDRHRLFHVLSGLCGIIGVFVPMTMITIAVQHSPWFRWDTNPLSDIGIHPEAALFNGALILGGLLFIVFTLGLRDLLGKRRWWNAATISLGFGSVFLILIGIFTENQLLLHTICAYGYFILAPVSILFFAQGTQEILLRRASLLFGILALLGILVVPFVLLPFNVGFAVPELIETTLLELWVLILAVYLLRNQTPLPRTPDSSREA